MPGVSEDQRGNRRDWSAWEQPTDSWKMWGRSFGTDQKYDRSSAKDRRRPRQLVGRAEGAEPGLGL